MNDSTVPAGWYPDAQNPAEERFWDGTAWTTHTRPLGGGAVTAQPQYAAQPESSGQQQYGAPYGGAVAAKPPANNKMIAYIILGVAAVVAIAVAVFIFMSGSNNGEVSQDQAKERYLGWLAADYPEVTVTDEHAMEFAVDYCAIVASSSDTADWQQKTGPYVEQVMTKYPQYDFTADLAVVMDMAIFSYCNENLDKYIVLADGAYTDSQWNMFKVRYSAMP